MQYPQNKVFCIGMNKTGTTSIGDALGLLGLKRLGWNGKISGPLTLRWHEGNYQPFVKFTKQYDAFEDVPWCFVYEEMYKIYPNAKFILTERKTPEAWLSSMQSHIERVGDWVGHYLIYGSYDPVKNADKYLERYNNHNEEVINFFADKPGSLLRLCFENGDGWPELCEFLGLKDIPSFNFPHSNKKPEGN